MNEDAPCEIDAICNVFNCFNDASNEVTKS